MKVLRSILDIEDSKGGGDRAGTALYATEEDGEIDFGGLSLEEFATQDLARIPNPGHGAESPAPVGTHREKYEDLHTAIAECDEVLKHVEISLTNFQTELGQVSVEIENLQARSMQLSAKLDNRRNVEKLLGPAVEEVTLSPSTVRAITEGPIDENFVRALNETGARSAGVDTKSKNADHVKALEDLKPLLDHLNARAIERIRDYLVSQIKALRSPQINAQVIQQRSFLRYKDLFGYLSRHHAVLADEIGQAYVNTMKWYYLSNFTRYQQALSGLPMHAFDQYDLLGAEPAPARRNVLGGSKTPVPPHDAFSLGRRIDILKSKNAAALPAYLAEDQKVAQNLEIPLRNFNQALIDNVCAEYAVATELFSSSSFHQVSRRVTEIFEPTFSLGQQFIKQLVENSLDCLGVLLCVRLNQHGAFELQRRKVPVADSYINYTNMVLWPRFQIVMDMHCDSLRRVSTHSNRAASAAFALVGGNDTSASVAPHAITQRFGQFLRGILTLSSDAGDDEPVSNSLARLRAEYEAVMVKLAKGAGDATNRAKFLYNNYSLVLTIISDTQGKLAEEQKDHFGTLMRK